MTKLRKLTALLLAGALTLLLLTACSGGGGSSGPEAQAEAKVMRAIRSNSSTKNLKSTKAAPRPWPMTLICSVSPKTNLPTPIWTPI